MFTDYTLIEYLTVLLGYLDLLQLQTRWQGTANNWEGLGPARRAFWVYHCLKLLYLMFYSFQLFIVTDYSCFMLRRAHYNSVIILAKIVAYYS